MIYGVDVHPRYQAGLDVPLLARQGYSLFACKATEGLGVVSVEGFTAEQFTARMLTWIAQARDSGMVPSLYHYLRAQDGAAQCDAFMRIVERAGGPEGFVIQLDNEKDATWTVTQQWAARWRTLTGGQPWLMYTGSWWWDPRGWPGATLTPYLWHSHYLSADTDTIADDPATFAARVPSSWWTPGYGGWPRATILQFTSRGDAGSLGNNVDLNATMLTREQLIALTRPIEGDDMLCKFGDKGPVVQAMQHVVLAAGGRLPQFGPDADYGTETATALAGLVGGDGKTYGPAQYAALMVAVVVRRATPGPAGPPGPMGPPGPPGQPGDIIVGAKVCGTITAVEPA